MLYHLDFRIDRPAGMSRETLFEIWGREAEAALAAKAAGVIVDLWKCVGSPRVVAIVRLDSPDALDQVLLDLPIMREHGQHVELLVTPLRRYEDFAGDMRERLAA